MTVVVLSLFRSSTVETISVNITVLTTLQLKHEQEKEYIINVNRVCLSNESVTTASITNSLYGILETQLLHGF